MILIFQIFFLDSKNGSEKKRFSAIFWQVNWLATGFGPSYERFFSCEFNPNTDSQMQIVRNLFMNCINYSTLRSFAYWCLCLNFSRKKTTFCFQFQKILVMISVIVWSHIAVAQRRNLGGRGHSPYGHLSSIFVISFVRLFLIFNDIRRKIRFLTKIWLAQKTKSWIRPCSRMRTFLQFMMWTRKSCLEYRYV